MCEKLLIFQKTYDFILWLYPIINRIPKSHRLVLGREIEELAVSLLLLITKANKAKAEKRLNLQLQASDQLDCLRILVRLSKDLRFISIKQYGLTVSMINEVGKMLHGWIKSGHKSSV